MTLLGRGRTARRASDHHVRRLWRKIRVRFIPDYRASRGGFAFDPVDITLQLTFACNVRCTMCYQHNLRDGTAHRGDFDEDTYPTVGDYRRFLAEASSLRPNIRLTGGEPFVYPHLMELAAHVKRLGLDLTIPTNGTCLAGFADAIVATPVDVLIVSINGPEEVHDRIVKKPGAYRKAVAGIEAVLRRRGKGKPRVVINHACANDNAAHMVEVVRLADHLGVDALSFTHLWYWDGPAVRKQAAAYPELGSLEPTAVEALDAVDPEAMIRALDEIARGGFKVPVMIYPDLPRDDIVRYYREPSVVLGGGQCLVPWLATYVRPNGDVTPSYLDYTVGNIKDRSFREIWNGEPMRRLRRALRAEGHLPACKRCTGMFLFRGHGDGRPALPPPVAPAARRAAPA